MWTGGRQAEEHTVLTHAGQDGVNTYETRGSVGPQPLCVAQLVERGCTAMSGHCLSRRGSADCDNHSLLPAAGFQFTALVPGLEEKTEIVAVPGPC